MPRINSSFDTLFGTSGNDVIEGPITGPNALWIRGYAGDDTLSGGDRRDLILGGAGNDTLFGGDQADALFGGAGDDISYGGAGRDQFQSDDGSDTYFGGLGIDTLNYAAATQSVIIDERGGQNRNAAEGDYFESIERFVGTDLADSFVLGDADNIVQSGGGADFIDTGNGDDRIIGNAGNDFLHGGNGEDWVIYLRSDSGVTIGMSGVGVGGDAEGDVLSSIEHIRGSRHADVLTGSGLDNSLFGVEGADSLVGLAGRDEIKGGAGHDTIDGGADRDALFGGAGHDLIYGWTGADQINGNGGDDRLFGQTGGDTLLGGSGHDVLAGGGANDVLDGETGFDTLFGGTGADRLILRAGDRGDGGSGADIYDLNLASSDLGPWEMQLVAGSYVGAALPSFSPGPLTAHILGSTIDLAEDSILFDQIDPAPDYLEFFDDGFDTQDLLALIDGADGSLDGAVSNGLLLFDTGSSVLTYITAGDGIGEVYTLATFDPGTSPEGLFI